MAEICSAETRDFLWRERVDGAFRFLDAPDTEVRERVAFEDAIFYCLPEGAANWGKDVIQPFLGEAGSVDIVTDSRTCELSDWHVSNFTDKSGTIKGVLLNCLRLQLPFKPGTVITEIPRKEISSGAATGAVRKPLGEVECTCGNFMVYGCFEPGGVLEIRRRRWESKSLTVPAPLPDEINLDAGAADSSNSWPSAHA